MKELVDEKGEVEEKESRRWLNMATDEKDLRSGPASSLCYFSIMKTTETSDR